jgi:hypothetical protein
MNIKMMHIYTWTGKAKPPLLSAMASARAAEENRFYSAVLKKRHLGGDRAAGKVGDPCAVVSGQRQICFRE